jgi:hypothetical protein
MGAKPYIVKTSPLAGIERPIGAKLDAFEG